VVDYPLAAGPLIGGYYQAPVALEAALPVGEGLWPLSPMSNIPPSRLFSFVGLLKFKLYPGHPGAFTSIVKQCTSSSAIFKWPHCQWQIWGGRGIQVA